MNRRTAIVSLAGTVALAVVGIAVAMGMGGNQPKGPPAGAPEPYRQGYEAVVDQAQRNAGAAQASLDLEEARIRDLCRKQGTTYVADAPFFPEPGACQSWIDDEIEAEQVAATESRRQAEAERVEAARAKAQRQAEVDQERAACPKRTPWMDGWHVWSWRPATSPDRTGVLGGECVWRFEP